MSQPNAEHGSEPHFVPHPALRVPHSDDADHLIDPVSRRQFLALLGASLGLAGLSGCSTRAPNDPILPYVHQPEEIVPGKAMYFATAMPLGGSAIPLLVESHEGRPTKVEGNPEFYDNDDEEPPFGPTDIFAQASVLTMYDPDRSQTVLYRGRISDWAEAQQALRQMYDQRKKQNGKGLWLLTEAVNSPTLSNLLADLKKQLPEARWVEFEPSRLDAGLEGVGAARGSPARVDHDFTKANVVLALDADFLTTGPTRLRDARDFLSRRRMENGSIKDMNRLYAIECMPTGTGLVADHRLALKPSHIETFARLLALELGVDEVPATAPISETVTKWVKAIADDLRKEENKGQSIVLAGDGQPPVVHALAFAINAKLGNLSQTVRARAAGTAGLRDFSELVRAMDAGQVEALIILGSNPVYASPSVDSGQSERKELRFIDALEKVPMRIHLGLYNDETGERCHWHIPEAHYLESWGDAYVGDDLITIMQPLIAPLYRGRSVIEVLAAFLDPSARTGYDLVRNNWRAAWTTLWRSQESEAKHDFEREWRTALHNGFFQFEGITLGAGAVQKGWGDKVKWSDGKAAGDYEVAFRLDPTLFDGRFANNGWLQELPKPVTQLTWDNAVMVSPRTARDLGVQIREGPHAGGHGDMLTRIVKLQYRGIEMTAPLWPVPGHPDGCATLHLGYGRERAGKVGSKTGFDFYKLWSASAPFHDVGLSLHATSETFTLACTQGYNPMEAAHEARGRSLVRAGVWDQGTGKVKFTEEQKRIFEEFDTGALPRTALDRERFDELPEEEQEREKRRVGLTMYDPHPSDGYKWGMSIDLGACIGCGACVVACQAENNIPIVGKEQVTRGREMHWIRIDRYFSGEDDNELERATFEPVPCMHCENAPCELVCPVAATTHSPDGLNEMSYNRCVGTRYCANNCPYKVRRFNFLQFADFSTPSLKLQRNPDVTVRSRGVMEKCTYCVQRIRGAEIESRNQNRSIRDGEVVTACQAVCPARAITFGDMNDKSSQVSKRKAEPLTYGLLLDLNTRPRTSYLAAVRNPNPALETEGEHGR
jgi:molybdopterin-containing oxidoreductase family iron-sulfur binding subunit